MTEARAGFPVYALLFAGLAALPYTVSGAPWKLQWSLSRGTPGGFIQVRENNVQGTLLPIGPDLGIDYVQRVHFGASDELGGGRELIFSLDLARLRGESVSASPVYFNGVQLDAGYPLISNAGGVNNWQISGLYRQPIFADAGARLDGELGFTYVGLTYSLQGHPAGASHASELSGSRTSEDFITQELPVPQFGLHFSDPLYRSIYLDAGFTGGHLPRLYSMRNEGGKVYVTQTNQSEHLGLTYKPDAGLRLGFGWYDRYFMQYEQSVEDGNYVQLSEHGYYLSMRYQF